MQQSPSSEADRFWASQVYFHPSLRSYVSVALIHGNCFVTSQVAGFRLPAPRAHTLTYHNAHRHQNDVAKIIHQDSGPNGYIRLPQLKPILDFQMNAVLICACRFQITEFPHTFKRFIARLYIVIRPFQILPTDTNT